MLTGLILFALGVMAMGALVLRFARRIELAEYPATVHMPIQLIAHELLGPGLILLISVCALFGGAK